MVVVDVDIWDVFCETFVILGVDFEVVEVKFVETEEAGVVDGFTVLLEVSLVGLAGTCRELRAGLAVRLSRRAGRFLLEDAAKTSLAAFSSYSINSGPTMNMAKPTRTPGPIVLRAG